jgi:hypothetical protein
MTYLNIPSNVVSVLDPLRPSPRLYAQIIGPSIYTLPQPLVDYILGPMRRIDAIIKRYFPDYSAVLKTLKVSF